MNDTDFCKAQDRHDAACAAGPELLAALKELLELCDMGATWENNDIEPYKFEAIVDSTLVQAARAIKLAEGK
jgi:hypothetical protein